MSYDVGNDSQDLHVLSSSSLTGESQSSQFEGAYFDLNDIAATNERLPCVFQVMLPKLGFLDPSSESENLKEGTKVELPVWLAKAVYTHQRDIIIPDMPKYFKENYRDILTADPTVVDLNQLSPYFYRVGVHLLHFHNQEAVDLCKTMLKAFQKRFRLIMDSSQNPLADATNIVKGLDEIETRIYEEGHKALVLYTNWETRDCDKLTTSQMVLNYRKRKRAEMKSS